MREAGTESGPFGNRFASGIREPVTYARILCPTWDESPFVAMRNPATVLRCANNEHLRARGNVVMRLKGRIDR
jgi:hypothetical protein